MKQKRCHLLLTLILIFALSSGCTQAQVQQNPVIDTATLESALPSMPAVVFTLTATSSPEPTKTPSPVPTNTLTASPEPTKPTYPSRWNDPTIMQELESILSENSKAVDAWEKQYSDHFTGSEISEKRPDGSVETWTTINHFLYLGTRKIQVDEYTALIVYLGIPSSSNRDDNKIIILPFFVGASDQAGNLAQIRPGLERGSPNSDKPLNFNSLEEIEEFYKQFEILTPFKITTLVYVINADGRFNLEASAEFLVHDKDAYVPGRIPNNGLIREIMVMYGNDFAKKMPQFEFVDGLLSRDEIQGKLHEPEEFLQLAEAHPFGLFPAVLWTYDN